jgi:hypothetical protein
MSLRLTRMCAGSIARGGHCEAEPVLSPNSSHPVPDRPASLTVVLIPKQRPTCCGESQKWETVLSAACSPHFSQLDPGSGIFLLVIYR